MGEPKELNDVIAAKNSSASAAYRLSDQDRMLSQISLHLRIEVLALPRA